MARRPVVTSQTLVPFIPRDDDSIGLPEGQLDGAYAQYLETGNVSLLKIDATGDLPTRFWLKPPSSRDKARLQEAAMTLQGHLADNGLFDDEGEFSGAPEGMTQVEFASILGQMVTGNIDVAEMQVSTFVRGVERFFFAVEVGDGGELEVEEMDAPRGEPLDPENVAIIAQQTQLVSDIMARIVALGSLTEGQKKASGSSPKRTKSKSGSGRSTAARRAAGRKGQS